LLVGVARVEQAHQYHRIKPETRQDAQVEVEGIEGGANDLRVRRDDGEAFLALRAEELEVEIDVGLLADAFEKAVDDIGVHQRIT
jgi:hypothetical protein